MNYYNPINHDLAKKLNKIELWEKLSRVGFVLKQVEYLGYNSIQYSEFTDLERDDLDNAIENLSKIKKSLELRILS